MRPLVDALPSLTLLDLGGCPLAASAVLRLCADRSGRPLGTLRLSASQFDDDCAMAAMELPHITCLDVSWTRLTGSGASALVLGLSERLVDLRLAHCEEVRAGDAAQFLPALAASSLARLSLAGLRLDAADMRALASLSGLRALDLRHCRLVDEPAERAFADLSELTRLRILDASFLVGATDVTAKLASGEADGPPLSAGTRSAWSEKLLRKF